MDIKTLNRGNELIDDIAAIKQQIEKTKKFIGCNYLAISCEKGEPLKFDSQSDNGIIDHIINKYEEKLDLKRKEFQNLKCDNENTEPQIHDIMDLFTNDEEFPDTRIDRMIQCNTFWEDVYSGYIKTYIECTEPFYVIIAQQPGGWCDKKIEEYEKPIFNKFKVDDIEDNVFILSESQENYWLFWNATGGNLIGKLDKKNDKETLKKYLIKFIKGTDNYTGKYMELLNIIKE